MDMYTAIAGEKPMARGSFRVVVSSGGKVMLTDFTVREKAVQYADDVAAEWSDEPQVAVVFDENLAQIHEGKAYFAK